LSEVCSDKVTSARIFSHSSDSPDSDFIQEYIDSFFPPADSKEVIEEGLEENIGEEEGDDGIPDEVSDEIGFQNRSANYHVLEKPMTTGIHLDVIQLIPWTGFEMGELGDEPGDWTDVFDEWFDYITDLLDDIADVLVSGFAYVAEFLTNLDEILKDWGMRVIGAISNFFSALRDAVSEVGELMSVLADWIVSHVSSLFSSVWERVTSGLESWAEGIQEAMEDFFEELAEWDEMDGSESVEDTMEAGSALMLSFIGLQDKASPLMDVVERVMNFIEPFQQYISPMGAMGTIADSLGGPMPEEVGNLFETVENIAT